MSWKEPRSITGNKKALAEVRHFGGAISSFETTYRNGFAPAESPVPVRTHYGAVTSVQKITPREIRASEARGLLPRDSF
jgi:hypothetical protein